MGPGRYRSTSLQSSCHEIQDVCTAPDCKIFKSQSLYLSRGLYDFTQMSHKVCKRDIRCITKFNVMGPKVKVTADVTPSEMLQDFFIITVVSLFRVGVRPLICLVVDKHQNNRWKRSNVHHCQLRLNGVQVRRGYQQSCKFRISFKLINQYDTALIGAKCSPERYRKHWNENGNKENRGK